MTIFTTALKRIMHHPINWVLVAAFPIVFALIITINANPGTESPWESSINIPFGIVDQDQTVLSQALVSQMETRFAIRELYEEDINLALTDRQAVYVLVIRQGYSENILAGVAPQLDGYTLAITDGTMKGSATARNITQALLFLGTDDPDVISQWQAASQFDIEVVGEANNLGAILQFLGMYGFIAMFMAYFFINSLLDDKRHGMPMRLGVLPVSTRKILAFGTLGAFTAMLVSTVILLVVFRLRLGSIPNLAHMLVLMALFNLFSVAFVLAVVSSIRNLAAVSVVITISSNMFAMLGGLFWPLEIVPPFMQRVAWFSPGYWLSRGVRNIQDIGFEGFWMPVFFLLGFTVVALLLGGWRKIQAVEE